MLDITDVIEAPRIRQELLQTLLALQQGQRPAILAPLDQQVEGEQHQRFGVAFRQRRLQGGKARNLAMVESHHFTVDDAVG